ncbi:MAG TPA: hypothetical protein VKA70_00670 [Blastocatellia bacterium]|nr:hypothetical protein [Blastocatellia bacterium]
MKKPATKDVLRFILVPLLFLTVALLGGVRFTADSQELRFLAPQLVSLILAVFVMIVFVRGGLIQRADYASQERGLIENASGLVSLAAIYFATTQVFNAVTPERGLLNFFFNLFYFLIFWNNLFVVFNPVRLTKSLAVVLGASFALKYLIFADLFAPTESWAKYALQKLMQTASLGALEFEAFAPATGYLAFATVALYIAGLYVISPRVDRAEELLYNVFIERHQLTPAARRRLIAAVAQTAAHDQDEEVIEAELVEEKEI